MSGFRVACPECGTRLKIADRALRGTEVACPNCEEVFEVPELEPAAGAAKERATSATAQTQPRKSKQRKRLTGSSVARYIVGGVVLLALVGVVVVVWTGRGKNRDIAGTPPAAGQPDVGPRSVPPRTGEPGEPTEPLPKLSFDASKLGYDPLRPDQTIPALKWPRRSSRGDTSLTAYNGRIIATTGRIYGLFGTDRGLGNAPLGRTKTQFYLFDADGRLFGDDGKAVAVSVQLADVMDWKQYRPGQVVKVIGRGQTPKDAPTSLSLVDVVVLATTGAGDLPMTTEQLAAAVRSDPKTYTGGFTADRYVTLNGVISDLPAADPQGRNPPVVVLAHSTDGVRCTISNWDEYLTSAVKVGDAVTIIGHAERDPSKPGAWRFRGLFLPKS